MSMTPTETYKKSVEEFEIKLLSGFDAADYNKEDCGASHEDVERIALKLNEAIRHLNRLQAEVDNIKIL